MPLSSRAVPPHRGANARRPLFCEPLEGRIVLSVCGVECALIDGQLHIHGATANDAIAVRYDAASDPVAFDGEAEAPSIRVSESSHGHQHAQMQMTGDQELSLSADPLDRAVSTSSLASSANGDSPPPMVHDTHDNLPDAPHASFHASHFEPPKVPLAHVPHANLAHGFRAEFVATAPVAIASGYELSTSIQSAFEFNASASDHNQHPEAKAKSESPAKLVPKRCTITASGGLLVTSVDGKRQCDCDAKSQAAQQIKQQLAGDQPAAGQSSLLAALADCQPCQRSAVLASLAADFAVCSLTSTNADQQPLAGLPLPMLQQLHGESCPEKSAYADSEEQSAEDAQLLHGLQIVGLATLAASVALLPTLRLNPPHDRDENYLPTADLLFGRFNVELLT